MLDSTGFIPSARRSTRSGVLRSLVVLLVGLVTAVVPAAPALAADDVVIETQPQPVSALEGDIVSFFSWASDFETVRWEFRSDDSQPWTAVFGATEPDLMFTASRGNAGDYRAVFVDADGIDHASSAATLSVAFLSWTPTPVFVPVGASITQNAQLVDGAGPIRWQTASSAVGPWSDLSGAIGGELNVIANLDLNGLWLRPIATVGARETTTTAMQLHIYPLEPAPPAAGDATDLVDAPYNVITSASVTDGVLTVNLIPAAAEVFGDATWFHGTVFPSADALGWARVTPEGTLTFDVSSLPEGEHTVLIRLPFPGGNAPLSPSGAANFTVTAVSDPGDDESGEDVPGTGVPGTGGPDTSTPGSDSTAHPPRRGAELAATGVDDPYSLSFLGAALLIAGALAITVRRRSRSA